MEVTGNYNAKNADGTINSVPREEIAKEFYRLHQDQYDTLVVISNFDYAMLAADSPAFYTEIKNNTQGIGRPMNDSSGSYGSGGRLQGMIDMGNISNLGISPVDPELFERSLNILAHEQLHRWGSYVRFKNPDGTLNSGLLGKDGSHWSYLLDTDGSLEYGNDWQNNGDGTYTSVSIRNTYSSLDLYLMGMIDKSQVPPMTLIVNPANDPSTMPVLGATVTGTTRTVTIDDIIAAEGERVPSAADSQKAFKTAYVFITQPGTFTGAETSSIENFRTAWAGWFANLTNGKGSIEDVAPGISITISSPANGTTVNKDRITVRGTVTNTANNETGVTVNGVPATVFGSQFIASNVYLADGQNTITVTATDTAGATTTATATVTRTGTAGGIRITSNIDSGVAPLEVALRIDGYANDTSPTVSGVGPGSIDWTNCTSYDLCRVKMTVEGVYYFTAIGTGYDGNTYQDTVVVTMLNAAKLDGKLKVIWQNVKTALEANDITGAVNNMATEVRAGYERTLTQAQAYLLQISQLMGNIRMEKVTGDVAAYELLAYKNGVLISHYVEFVHDSDGIWRLSFF